MPLYEYKCEGCGEVFEVRQKFSDEPVLVHEKCGGKVEKLISTSSFQLKGSGWYATDYKKGGNGAKKSEPEGKSSESKSSETETKTPAATETKTSGESTTKPESKPAESKPAGSDKSKSE